MKCKYKCFSARKCCQRRETNWTQTNNQTSRALKEWLLICCSPFSPCFNLLHFISLYTIFVFLFYIVFYICIINRLGTFGLSFKYCAHVMSTIFTKFRNRFLPPYPAACSLIKLKIRLLSEK